MADLPCEICNLGIMTSGMTRRTDDGYCDPVPMNIKSGVTINTTNAGYNSFSGGTSTINYYKMSGKLISTGAWVTWTVTSSPDSTGAQYSGGPSSLVQTSIHIKNKWTR